MKKKRCVIVSGSPETKPEFLAKTIKSDDYVICADKGYYYANLAKIVPNMIIGDFDSYEDKLPSNCEIIKLVPEKDDTDTEHCAKVAVERGFEEVIILGSLGGRIDHTFSNISILFYFKKYGVNACLLSQNEQVIPLETGEHSFSQKKGLTFSLFPFGCRQIEVSISGAKYLLSNGKIRFDTSLGVSNIFTSDISEIKIHSGNAVMVINNRI